MKRPKVAIALRVPVRDADRLRKAADRAGVTRGALLRDLVSAGLAKLEGDPTHPPAARPDPEALPARRSFSKRDLEVLTVALLARAELEADAPAPLVSDLRLEAERVYGPAISWGLLEALRRLEGARWVDLVEGPEVSAAERHAGVLAGGRSWPRARGATPLPRVLLRVGRFTRSARRQFPVHDETFQKPSPKSFSHRLRASATKTAQR